MKRGERRNETRIVETCTSAFASIIIKLYHISIDVSSNIKLLPFWKPTAADGGKHWDERTAELDHALEGRRRRRHSFVRLSG